MFNHEMFVVDELSAFLLPLGALVYLVTVLSTLRTKAPRFSLKWTLFSETLVLATFSCREFVDTDLVVGGRDDSALLGAGATPAVHADLRPSHGDVVALLVAGFAAQGVDRPDLSSRLFPVRC